MKTKTIDSILKSIHNISNELNLSEKNHLGIHTFMMSLKSLMTKEKQRKEQKKPKTQLSLLSKLLFETNCYLDEKGNVQQKAMQLAYEVNEFTITPTGKVIINDGEKFEELFAKLAKAYLKQINQPSLIIIGD